ncbi:unnamed protein product [Candidula unifasciata]|uniref:G-protein coupled receptors family 1 profile domain-containing protein n=1 Tax=Candidula unifasciata TaxID=100452 RepID=A0A8S3ZH58_9EUPU|nr:unnamed protein product [Candidula unifasciata]
MENGMGNGSCFEDYDSSALVAFKVLQDVTLILGIVTNSVLFITICCSGQLRATTYIYIASLAVSDIIFSCHGIRYTLMGNDSEVECDASDFRARDFIFFNKVSSAANYANILMVSLERWLYIARPFLHQRYLSIKITVCGLATAWLFAIIVNIDTFIASDIKYTAVIKFKLNVVFPSIHFFVSCILCIVYVHLALIARGQLRAINRTRPVGVSNSYPQSASIDATNATMASIKENLKSLRLLVLVFGSFFVLMTPGICLHLYDKHDYAGVNHPILHGVFKQMTFTHCCVNFFVFATQNCHFRQIFLGYFRKIYGCLTTDSCRELCTTAVTPNMYREQQGEEARNPKIVISVS